MEDIHRSGKPQFTELRLKVLTRLGFKNNFIQTGLEADDIIASVVKDHAWEFDQVYIVTSDEDLFQLLHNNVSIYNPREKKFYTKEDFINEKGIEPEMWHWVKAVAGCSGDNVKGIKGVGEKTAIKFLRNELKPGNKWSEINQFDPSFNMSLVKLPHERTFPIELVPDALDFSMFEGLCLDYGFNSFLKKENYNKWRGVLCR
jgi:hypothetical protein